MSRLQQDASSTTDDTATARAERDAEGGIKPDAARSPTTPSDAAPKPVGQAPGHHEPEETIAEAFGIDEKNLYHGRSDD